MGADSKEAQTDSETNRGLSIYGYPQCPFCRRVLDVASSLGLEIPLRNTLQEGDRRGELKAATGRTMVPVLRIDDEASGTRWIPESADIVEYLVERFGAET